ncbi:MULTISPECIES: BREX system Lon protease-like protein BrxL [Mycobacteriaceae]|uniref:BREX system Lon protease-like protein BrxL n=1 Tax=Mycolicibacterium parafortuitum TaxID=39692 RepID=A0ACC6MPD5_MYCPF|nr:MULTISPECIES: BREX system Lon protease-like protein BrxL [Mycobacteriaceae]MDZ5088717.1 BREX system Lon protease-like protein BrxL [Mycolicibacterium parafortuitum]GFM18351.1 ATP-dependent Lon protease [Mycobacterium sp. PO1]GFM24371.1 ATP-dependent Lon protease [Mycobacterium sp. PO2]
MSAVDDLDSLAARVFEGYLVRKDLAQQFRGQYPVPTYVGEFLLGRYCATTDPDEIAEGLAIVERSMKERTVRAGEEELFKSRAREKGRVKIIDLLRARLDARSDSYKAELPSLQLSDIHIADELVNEHDRMLTGGFYAEVSLEYIAALGRDPGGQPFRVESVRPIQMSTRDAVDTLIDGRKHFTLDQWRGLLLRSVGFEPARFSTREQDVLLARMVPFVVPNYNAVELGPRGTGKSHLYQQISPYAHLVSGGKATIANMFVNNATGRRGLVAQYDVICFDEVSGVSFDTKEGVNILKGYMESGEFSRGKESIRAEGGIVMVGNFDVDVLEELRRGHLFGPMPKEMRNDTAFHDRIHAYLPGWDVPKLDPSYFTKHFGFVSDFLAECWSQLRRTSRLEATQGRLEWGSQLSGRDRKAANNTVNGLLKLLWPDPTMQVPDDALDWAAELALEMRRRVKEQQAFIGAAEFGKVDLSYRVGDTPETVVYCDESVKHRLRLESGAAQESNDASGREALPEPDANEVSARVAARDYQVGDRIGGRFEVEEVLGSGGFSKVYRVLDTVEGEQRALKLFETAAGYDAVRREIGALRKAQHPNIVKVIWADSTDQGEWYLVMEYVNGELLADYATGKKQLRDREAIDVALDVLNALIAIHPDSARLDELDLKKREDELSAAEYEELMSLSEKALVHRDIKPQNIMLTRSGAKLLDFNIASRVGDPVYTVSGTPPYQPPDADLTRWDVTTDLFAVGVTLYELLCDGQHPYPGARPMGGVEPTDPRQFRADLPPSVADFLLKACGSDRRQRFQTAAEMKAALETARSWL